MWDPVDEQRAYDGQNVWSFYSDQAYLLEHFEDFLISLVSVTMTAFINFHEILNKLLKKILRNFLEKL